MNGLEARDRGTQLLAQAVCHWIVSQIKVHHVEQGHVSRWAVLQVGKPDLILWLLPNRELINPGS
ncbi:hypothetical protein D3C76_1721050 [compost metagenome]